MRVSLVDLRNPDHKTSLVEADAPIVIVIGHGSPDSIGGFKAKTFPVLPSAQVVWFYACNCGKSLITEIARRGVIAFGYITSVLAPASVESSVASYIKICLEGYSGSLSPIPILSYVQELLFEKAFCLAQQAMDQQNGLLLLQAALINHTRLSLRFAT